MWLTVLNETGSAHKSNRLVDFSIDHYTDTFGHEEFWSIVVLFKGSFGRKVADLIGIGERIISRPYHDERSAKRSLSDLFSEFCSVMGDHTNMSQAIQMISRDPEHYEEMLNDLFYDFSYAGR